MGSGIGRFLEINRGRLIRESAMSGEVGSLAGKVALVTGAARGVGVEVARQLGALGAAVLVGARHAGRARATAQQLMDEGIAARGVKLDITSPADREAARTEIAERHGVLDILINNAAVWLESPSGSEPPPNRTGSLPTEILERTFATNFFAPVALTQALLPLIRRSSAGRIVNVSSILASLTLHSDPGSANYDVKAFAYGASKTALNAFTVHLAHELRDSAIKVNCIHPGWLRTEMGGADARLDLAEGSRPIVRLACLPADGPTGRFVFDEAQLPW